MENGSKAGDDLRHKFSADRPIKSREEDLLDRATFADSLASAIRGWQNKDSLVIALYGPWGSGKSSIKNMVLQALRSAESNIPQIVEFNPWQWAGQDKVAEAFFREIGLALGKSDVSKDARKRAVTWRAYAATWKAGSFAVRGFHKLVLILVAMLAATGLIGNFPEGHWLKNGSNVISFMAVVLLVLDRFYGFIGTFSETIASVFETRSQADSQNLSEQKEDLSELLRQLKDPILVVIDDVDRLSAEEIKLLFQIVKANADFPNLVYLLLFQRDIVERSLDSTPAFTGREFLEKIVQVGFDIPRIDRTRLEKILFADLDQLLNDEKVGKHFDQKRWGNLFLGGLRPYFETLRDIYRYLATLSFHISLFRSTGSFEVNPLDLIALEVLRVFEPTVYAKLPDVKSDLTRLRDHAHDSHDANERTRRIVESMIEGANQPTQVREILKQLFPPIEWIFGGHLYGHDFDEEWFRQLRICHPDAFDRYFHFTIPEGDISQAQIDRILSLVSDRDGLVSEFRSLKDRGVIAITLDRLEAYKQQINIQNASSFITALFDIGDDLPEERGGFYTISSDMHASRIVYWFLKQEKDVGKRGQILKDAMTTSRGLYLPIMVTSLESRDEKREKDPDAFNVTDTDLKELQRICVEKIEYAANSGDLVKHPQMASILYRWRAWTSPEIPQQWAQKLIESPQGALSFLAASLQRSTSHGIGDYVSQEHWQINLKSVEDFVSIDALETKVAGLPLDGLNDKQKKAVEVFQKAIKRRRDGKSDGTWRYDQDD